MKNIFRILAVLLLLHLFTSDRTTAIPLQQEALKQDAQAQFSSLAEAENLINEAGKLYQQGKYNQAIASGKRALQIREKLLSGDDPVIVANLKYLARLYRANGEYDEAKKLYLQVLRIQEAKLEPTNFELARTLKEAACMSRRIAQQDEAKEFDERASKIISAGITITDKSSSGIIQGRILKQPAPKYPEEAKRRGIAGEVLVEIIFDETGKVVYACAIKGQPLLSIAAEEAAMRAVFTPASLAGVSIKVTGVMIYQFKP